jgi:hypothetical protein
MKKLTKTSVLHVVQDQDHLACGSQKRNGMYKAGFVRHVLMKGKNQITNQKNSVAYVVPNLVLLAIVQKKNGASRDISAKFAGIQKIKIITS